MVPLQEKNQVIGSILPKSFYQREDVLIIGQQLLGKYLFTRINGKLTGGIIIETESYKGAEDKACHAYNNRRTPRTEIMFAPGGVAYVYFCYGMHYLFNIVTNKKQIPHAVLIRSILPTIGMDTMLQRRKKKKALPTLTIGPACLTQALGITLKHNGTSLSGSSIWLEDGGIFLNQKEIIASPRIGVDYAKEHALLPWRFCVNLKETALKRRSLQSRNSSSIIKNLSSKSNRSCI